MPRYKPYRVRNQRWEISFRHETPSIRFRFLPGVDPNVRFTLRLVAKWFSQQSIIKHRLNVLVVPRHYLIMADGTEGSGCFEEPLHKTDHTRIVISAPAVSRKNRNYKWLFTQIVVTLLHELVHYEQWRDGKDTTERGVEQRAVALANRASKEFSQ